MLLKHAIYQLSIEERLKKGEDLSSGSWRFLIQSHPFPAMRGKGTRDRYNAAIPFEKENNAVMPVNP